MNFLGQVAGWFANPTHWQGDSGIPNRLYEHLLLSATSLVAAAAIALPIGIALGHYGRFGTLAINVSNVGRAVPSFALLVISLEAFGIGFIPPFIALVALGIPPMVTNSYVGMRQVDDDIREAARGMGMRQRIALWRVELPIALPLIMAGIRTSASNIVATATLAALVAWGGLGRFIIDGFSQRDTVQIFSGAVLVALLAIFVEVGLSAVQRLTVPEGLRLTQSAGEVATVPQPAVI